MQCDAYPLALHLAASTPRHSQHMAAVLQGMTNAIHGTRAKHMLLHSFWLGILWSMTSQQINLNSNNRALVHQVPCLDYGRDDEMLSIICDSIAISMQARCDYVTPFASQTSRC
jgi:hypothetical protein